MEEIEIGEYVRLKSGKVGIVERVDYFESGELMGIVCKDINWYIQANSIAKHSKNIIDLIEVGDYVNEMLVTYINENKTKISVCHYNGFYANNLDLITNDIKSIVTKEQFENVEYKVESEDN